jgi:hypothetical protein
MGRSRAGLYQRFKRAQFVRAFGNFTQTYFRDRISLVWHPSGMRNPFASGSGGIVADAPQPPANVCDPSGVKKISSMPCPSGLKRRHAARPWKFLFSSSAGSSRQRPVRNCPGNLHHGEPRGRVEFAI